MSNTVIEVPIDTLRDGVNLSVASAALAEKVASVQAAVDNKAPLVVDALIQNGWVDALDKKATLDLLSDPVAALDVISRMANQPRTRSWGQSEKSASANEYDPQNRPEPESDRAFAATMRTLGA